MPTIRPGGGDAYRTRLRATLVGGSVAVVVIAVADLGAENAGGAALVGDAGAVVVVAVAALGGRSAGGTALVGVAVAVVVVAVTPLRRADADRAATLVDDGIAVVVQAIADFVLRKNNATALTPPCGAAQTLEARSISRFALSQGAPDASLGVTPGTRRSGGGRFTAVKKIITTGQTSEGK